MSFGNEPAQLTRRVAGAAETTVALSELPDLRHVRVIDELVGRDRAGTGSRW